MKCSLVALALLATGCGDTRGAPTLVVLNQMFWGATVAWMHPEGEVKEGYAVEFRRVPEPFATADVLSTGQTSYQLLYSPDVGEVDEVEIRVRALPDNDGSRASNAVSVRRGLLVPGIRCAAPVFRSECAPFEGAFYLRFHNRSLAADSLELRRTINGGEPAQLLTFDPSTTEYRDTDLALWVHGAAYWYALTAVKGQFRSAPVYNLITSSAPP